MDCKSVNCQESGSLLTLNQSDKKDFQSMIQLEKTEQALYEAIERKRKHNKAVKAMDKFQEAYKIHGDTWRYLTLRFPLRLRDLPGFSDPCIEFYPEFFEVFTQSEFGNHFLLFSKNISTNIDNYRIMEHFIGIKPTPEYQSISDSLQAHWETLKDKHASCYALFDRDPLSHMFTIRLFPKFPLLIFGEKQ